MGRIGVLPIGPGLGEPMVAARAAADLGVVHPGGQAAGRAGQVLCRRCRRSAAAWPMRSMR